MIEGRNRGPLSCVVSRRVLVGPRCSDARGSLTASALQSRRSALRLLSGAVAVLLAAPAAPDHTVSAQEMSDPGPGRWQTGDKEVVVSIGAQRLWAYEGDHSILATFVSTGTAETPEVV